jgi:IclR family acetate operon transcriptional repressor
VTAAAKPPPPRKLAAWHVARTMEILELIAFSPMAAPQVAAVMGANPRTVRRVLERLAEEEWVTCSDDARRLWSPTLRLVALAGWTLERSELTRLGRPYIALLRERTGAVAHLVSPSYAAVVCVAHAAGREHESSRVRELVPAHATAGGKALLAFRRRWRESILDGELERFTERTIVEPEVLRVHLDAVLRDGYATEDGEYQDGIRAVAAPVFQHEMAVAALSLSGPGLHRDEAVTEVLDTAARLSQELRSA